jgi:hypothetical protein
LSGQLNSAQKQSQKTVAYADKMRTQGQAEIFGNFDIVEVTGSSPVTPTFELLK